MMRWANSSQLPLLLIMEASLSFELLHLWIGNVGEVQWIGSRIYICFSGILLGASKIDVDAVLKTTYKRHILSTYCNVWDSIAGKWEVWSLSSLKRSAIVTGWCSLWGEFAAFIWTHYIVALGRLQVELCMFQRNCKSCLLCLQGALVLFQNTRFDCYDMIMNCGPYANKLNCFPPLELLSL